MTVVDNTGYRAHQCSKLAQHYVTHSSIVCLVYCTSLYTRLAVCEVVSYHHWISGMQKNVVALSTRTLTLMGFH